MTPVSDSAGVKPPLHVLKQGRSLPLVAGQTLLGRLSSHAGLDLLQLADASQRLGRHGARGFLAGPVGSHLGRRASG